MAYLTPRFGALEDEASDGSDFDWGSVISSALDAGGKIGAAALGGSSSAPIYYPNGTMAVNGQIMPNPYATTGTTGISTTMLVLGGLALVAVLVLATGKKA